MSSVLFRRFPSEKLSYLNLFSPIASKFQFHFPSVPIQDLKELDRRKSSSQCSIGVCNNEVKSNALRNCNSLFSNNIHDVIGCRQYSEDANRPCQPNKDWPEFGEHDIKLNPTLISGFKAFMKAIKFRSKFDPYFDLPQFCEACKQSLEVWLKAQCIYTIEYYLTVTKTFQDISHKLAACDFDGLRFEVTPEEIERMKKILTPIDQSVRNELAITKEDILAATPYNFDIVTVNDEHVGQRYYAETLMIFHAIKNYKAVMKDKEM